LICILHPCRHGDFFTAVLKSQPQFINDWKGKLWSRFFCLSVYITMYLNDHQVSGRQLLILQQQVEAVGSFWPSLMATHHGTV
jgi:hypothetical protein